MPRESIYFCDLPALILLKFPDSRPQHPGSDKSADSADHVDTVGACIVVKAPLYKESSAPCPVRLDRINHGGYHCGIDAVAGKLCPFRHRTRYNGGCGRAEYQVEDKCGIVEVSVICKNVKRKPARKTFQDVFPQHQRSAADKPHDCTDTEVHQVLHDDIARVFRSGKTCFAHGKSRLHPEYEGGTDQKPYRKYLSIHCFQQFLCHNSPSFSKRKGVSGTAFR